MELIISNSLVLLKNGLRNHHSLSRFLTVSEQRVRKSYLISSSFHASSCRKDIYKVQDLKDFEQRVLKSKIPVVVDFHATWCGPCKMLEPRLESIISSYGEKVHLAKVDVDCHTELALEYEVTAVPAVVAIKDGQVVDKFFGLQDEDQIHSFVNKVIGSDADLEKKTDCPKT